MYTRRLILSALLFPTLALSAQQQQGGAAPSAATISAAARSARLDRARARSASIDGKRFDLTPADFTGLTPERARAGVYLGVLDNEATAAEDVSLPAGRFNLYLTQTNGAWTAYAEQGGRLYPAKRTIEKADGPPNNEPAFRRGSGCWWIWMVFFSVYVCW